MLGFHTEGTDNGLSKLKSWFLPIFLISCQIAPPAVGAWVVGSYLRKLYETKRKRMKRLEDAPGALKDEAPKHHHAHHGHLSWLLHAPLKETQFGDEQQADV